MLEPTLVYTAESADRDAMDAYLAQSALYRYDDLAERDADMARPVVDRPILRRVLLYSALCGLEPDVGRRSLDYEPFPSRLVVDCLESLGPDLGTQVTVVGAFMENGLSVVVDQVELTKVWYTTRREMVDDDLQLRLLETPGTQIIDAWATRNPGHAHFMWTSISPARSYPEAVRLIHHLVKERGHTRTSVARILRTAGYRNRFRRVKWTAANVGQALEETP